MTTRTATGHLAAPEPWLTWRLLHRGAARNPDGLVHQALRTRSPALLEALARAASGGRSSDELLRQVLDAGPPVRGATRAQLDTLAGTALVWAGMMRSTQEVHAAALVFEQLWETGRAHHVHPNHHVIAAQTLFLAGRHAQLVRLLPRFEELPEDVRHYLHTDLANPWAEHPPGFSSAAPEEWGRLLGELFARQGLAGPGLLPEDGTAPTLFDRLHAEGPVPGSAGGDLVTVVMPCFRPDRGLITSVRSISRQTWADLEIILVDDASGPAYADVFAEAASLDPRAKVLTMARNGGSYLAREAAIAASTGSLVTFQDADDWSHPCRIEHQVELLHERSAAVSRSLAVRAKEDLTHQWLGFRPVRPNASSLLVRREVLDRLGGFVPVRKGADSEYAERLQALTGAIADTWTPLAITRLRSGSLSRGDFLFSWFAPDRLSFRSSFMAWHRELRRRAEAGEEIRVTAEDLHAYPFAVPPGWVRGLEGESRAPTRLGRAYLGNFSGTKPSESVRWLHEQLSDRAPSPEEGPVGIWHQEAPWISPRPRPRVSNRWADLVHTSGAFLPVSRADRVHVHRLVVVDPEVVTLMTGQPCAVSVAEVDVWLTPRSVQPDASLLPEDLLGVADVLGAWWGVRPRWVFAPHLGADDREHVRASLPGLRIVEDQSSSPAPGGRPRSTSAR